MKKLRIETFKLLLVIALIFGTITTSVYGWFSSKANTISTKVTGSIVFEYFHCGDGSKENPFVITRPIHYYHMVEFFQRVTILSISNNEKAYFGKDYLYFQIGCPLAQLGDPSNTNDPVDANDWYVFDYSNTGGVNEKTNTQGETVVPGSNALASKTLNMAYYSGERALMPTGSSEVPFLGSIDGHNMTIDNLHIVSSSVVNVVEENGTIHSNIQRQTADMGVFGCIARGIDLNENGTVENVIQNDAVTIREQSSIKNLYITNATIDLNGTATSTEIVGDLPTLPSGDSLHSNDYHLVNEAGEVVEENGTEVAYVGYVAGHVESGVEISRVYVNRSKILGGTKAMNGYGYFGIIIDSKTGETISSLDTAVETVEQGSGQPNWGGSIDMKSLNIRLYNHLNDLTHTSYSTNGYYGKYVNTYSNISVVRGDKAKTYYTRDPLTTQTFYNLMGNGNHTYKEKYTLPGTYIPLLENADGSLPDKNTGYIVSDSQAMNNANGTVRSASYQMRYIANSLVGTKATDVQVYKGTGSAANVSFNTNNLEILTNKGTTYSSSNYYLIKDSYNQSHNVTNAAISSFTKSDATTPENLELKKYNASREALDAVLTNQSFIHGIHFMGTAISQNTTLTIPTAVINGETKTNYVVPKSCIDFNLKEDGIINFFGGSYYARSDSLGSYADSFFSLNYITRNAQDGITSIKQINNIYLNTNTAEGQPKYVYQFSDNTYSTGTRGELVFNMSFIMNEPPARNALYYFEIPVNAGEYALGTVSGKSGGGYLMYLDIATNGAGEEETEVIVGGNETDPIPYFNVDFRNPTDEASLLSDHAILQFAVKCPEETVLENSTIDDRKFSIYVEYDKNDKGTNNIYPKGTYSIYITNKIPSTSIYLTVYLSDDDYDSGTDFEYAYKIIYTNLDVTNHIVGTYQKVDVYVIPSSE